MTYTVCIMDRSTYKKYAVAECGHKHRKYSGACRCLDRLSKYWPDGTHNQWAHSGEIRHSDFSDIDYGVLLDYRERDL